MLFETSQNQHYIPKYGLVPESISTPAATYKHSDSHLFVQFPDKEKILQLCTSLLHLFKHGINLDTPSYMCDVMEYLVSFPGFPRLSFSPLFRFRLFILNANWRTKTGDLGTRLQCILVHLCTMPTVLGWTMFADQLFLCFVMTSYSYTVCTSAVGPLMESVAYLLIASSYPLMMSDISSPILWLSKAIVQRVCYKVLKEGGCNSSGNVKLFVSRKHDT